MAARPEAALYLPIPAGAVRRPLPELLAGGVVNEPAGLWVAADDSAGAVGDVAEVAEHGALLAFLDGGVERSVATDGLSCIASHAPRHLAKRRLSQPP